MIALLACVAVFLAAYTFGRRSLIQGILVTLVAGYVYGIFRANFLTPFSHFLADAAVVGLFMAQLLHPLPVAERRRLAGVRAWLFVLVLWPVILFLVPVQDPLVQLVGLRGAVLVLGFLLLGARISSGDWYRLAIWIALLNLGAFVLALAEFWLGIEPFFPQSAVTEIMYRSRVSGGDETGQILYRIPSSFSSAHAYGGTMVVTLPLLLGAWVGAGRTEFRRLARGWHRPILVMAILASALGVFMSAARQHAIMLFLLIVSATLFGRIRTSYRVSWVVVLLTVGGIVAQTERLQRFTTLEDDDMVRDRLHVSVNESFLQMAERFPMGNGLGGGGTSMPYFLLERVRTIGVLENEYGRIMLEQGIPGLLMWIAFVGWVVVKGAGAGTGEWAFARRLAWIIASAYLLTAAIGLGLLASIPQSYVLFLLMGWIVVQPGAPHRSRVSHGAAPGTVPLVPTGPGAAPSWAIGRIRPAGES